MKSNPQGSGGLFHGEYLFHLHTVHTDGKMTVAEYFEYAGLHQVDRLIFLEHIRREPTYDVAGFAAEVASGSASSGIAATLGFEAKILPDGALDISEEHLQLAAVLGVAEHGFSDDYQQYQAAFKTAMDRCEGIAKSKTVVWVHPGLWFKKRRLLQDREGDYLKMLAYAQSKGVHVERNHRYDLIPEHLLSHVESSLRVTGIDVHGMDQLKTWWENYP